MKEGSEIAVLTNGITATNALEAIETSSASEKAGCYDMRFIKPLDEKLLHSIFRKYKTIITVEDGVILGGFGSSIAEFASQNQYTNKIEILGIPDAFPEHGSIEELQQLVGISADGIRKTIELHI